MKKFTAFVCYLDLLGTKGRFLNKESTRHEIDRLARVQQIMRNILAANQPSDENTTCSNAFFFSDGGCVVEETDAHFNGEAQTDNELACSFFLQNIADCQTELIREGFLVRGYATVGMVGVGPDFAVGPAVCKAVAGEASVCGPFVQVDEELLQFVYKGYYRERRGRKAPDDELFGGESWNDFFLYDQRSGAILLNYMNNWEDLDVDITEALARQKETIESYGPKTEQSAAKYFALASFHNQVVQMRFPHLANDPGTRFLVSEDALSMMAQFNAFSLSNAIDKLTSIRAQAYASVQKELSKIT